MKVFNLQCGQGHVFEGWFASAEDFERQLDGRLLTCPLCEDEQVQRMPSAPRLNLGRGGAPGRAAEAPGPASDKSVADMPADERKRLQAVWLQAARDIMQRTEDVGERFVEEARRIHYGEAEKRDIRGKASLQQAAELKEEGIEVSVLPLPDGMDDKLQ